MLLNIRKCVIAQAKPPSIICIGIVQVNLVLRFYNWLNFDVIGHSIKGETELTEPENNTPRVGNYIFD